MKHYSLILTAAAALMMATACTNDDMPAPINGDGNVTLTVQLPGDVGTRAYGDGTTAKTLSYAVYSEDGKFLEKHNASFGTALSTNITLKLVNGVKYKVAFFAYYNSNNVYSFDAENHSVTVNYNSMFSTSRFRNDYDCFYKMEEIEVNGPAEREVILNRPVAQINWGTDDKNDPIVQETYGSIYSLLHGDACTKLDLLTGEASEEKPLNIEKATYVDSSVGAFPIEGYDYVHTMYLLMPEGDSNLIDLELVTGPSRSNLINTVKVTNVPVQRNFRTNIYGSLLTSKTNIKVTKDEIFGGYNDYEIWDGKPGTITPDANGNYTVSTPSQLAALAQIVNNGNSLDGKTVTLARDLDLNNHNWTPIGTKEKPFNGSFKGQNHKISNLYINLDGKPAASAGLIGHSWTNTAELSDLVIENAVIDVTGATGAPKNFAIGVLTGGGNYKLINNIKVTNAKLKGYHYAGAVAGSTYGNVTNCSASDIEIVIGFYDTGSGLDYGDKAGGIFGLHGEGGYTISGNKASNITITGFRDLGGLFGMLHNENKYSNNVADNITITGISVDKTQLADDAKSGNLGGVAGRKSSTSVDEGDNNATNVTIYTPNENVASAEDLMTAAAKGGYIQVTGDITLPSGSITLDKPTTLAVAKGKTVTIAGTVNNTSTLTIEGEGTVKSTTAACIITNKPGGTVILNSGRLELETTDGNQAPVYSEGTVIVNGGELVNSKGNALRLNLGNEQNPGNVYVEINGGTMRSGGNYALNLYGSSKTGAKVVINGGTYIGATGSGRADNGIDVTINGGTFIGKGVYHGFVSGAESYGSQNCKVTVNGGYFYGTNGHALCRAGSSTMIVNGAFVNKTTGDFTLGNDAQISDANVKLTVDENDYIFSKQIK